MRPTLALLALLVFAPAADAAWSGQTLSSGHAFVDDTRLVVGANGSALAAWRFQDGTGNGGRAGHGAAARAPGAAAFERSRGLVRATPNVRPGTTIAGLEAYGRRRALLALLLPGAADRPAGRLGVRFGSTSGRFGRTRVVRRAGAHRIAGASLAVNVRGDAALAWFEDRGVRTDRLYVALRRAGGRFGAPRRLATGRIRGVAAAIGASGDVLVAWDNLGVLRTRFKPRRRDGFRAAERIRSRPAFFAQMRPVVTANGRAVLAWSAQFASEGGEPGDAFFQAAVRPASGERFRRAELLERLPAGEAVVGRPIDAADDSTGDVVIAWSGGDGVNRRVRAARVEQSGDVGPAAVLSPPGGDALLSDLAAGPRAQLIAVWDGGVEATASTVHAAVAPAADRPFGPPELVSPAGQDARFGAGGFGRDGRAMVVYSNRPDGSGRTYAQASTRSE